MVLSVVSLYVVTGAFCQLYGAVRGTSTHGHCMARDVGFHTGTASGERHSILLTPPVRNRW